MSETIQYSVKGLYTSPNTLDAPEGSQLVADNMISTEVDVIKSRRGQTQYGIPLQSPPKEIFNYGADLLVFDKNGTLYKDSDGAGQWVAYNGNYKVPEGALTYRRVQQLQNLYFLTDAGVYKIDNINSQPYLAGAPDGLGGFGTTTGSNGFFPSNTNVAYKIVWGRNDANNNLVLGAPSFAINVSNSGATSANVNLTFSVPRNLDTTWFYQVYRSRNSTSLTSSPSADYYMVQQNNLTLAQITALEVTITDITPSSLSGTALYTNQGQQKAQAAQYRPPVSADVVLYNGFTYYANTRNAYSININLLGVGDGTNFSYVLKQNCSMTAGTSVIVVPDNTNIRVGQFAYNPNLANAVVTNINGNNITISTTIGQNLTQDVEFQDGITINGKSFYGASRITNNSQFIIASTTDPAVNIQQTAINLCNAVNKFASSDINAYYLSGFTDLPGLIQFKQQTITKTGFSVSSSNGSAFSPNLKNNVAATNNQQQSFLWYSAFQQPEAVPLSNYIQVGSSQYPIKRIIALRTALLVFKDDGIFRIVGTPPDITDSILDNTSRLGAIESLRFFENQVIYSSPIGIVQLSDNGVPTIISDNIKTTFDYLTTLPNFYDLAYGVSYDEDRSYILFCPSVAGDTQNNQAYVYNYATGVWTRWVMTRTCGYVNVLGETFNNRGLLYTGNPNNNQVYQERKSVTEDDYADEQFAVIIINIDQTNTDYTKLFLNSVAKCNVGDTIRQGFVSSEIASINQLNNSITLTSKYSFELGDANIYYPIKNTITWNNFVLGDASVYKFFREVRFIFRDAGFTKAKVTFASNVYSIPSSQEITIKNYDAGWSLFGWGNRPWGGSLGGSSVIREFVTPNHSRCQWLVTTFELSQAFNSCALHGIAITAENISERGSNG